MGELLMGSASRRTALQRTATARCTCGLTWSTTRTASPDWAHAIDALLTQIRRHLNDPAYPPGPTRVVTHHHEITVFETKVWLYQ